MRQALVELFASILGVKVIISYPETEEDDPEPANLEYRIARETKVSGDVYFYVEQYFRKREDLRLLFPRSTHFDTEVMVNGRGASQTFS